VARRERAADHRAPRVAEQVCALDGESVEDRSVVNRPAKCSTWAAHRVWSMSRLGNMTIAGPFPDTETATSPSGVVMRCTPGC